MVHEAQFYKYCILFIYMNTLFIRKSKVIIALKLLDLIDWYSEYDDVEKSLNANCKL
jgi:hypothetical protein